MTIADIGVIAGAVTLMAGLAWFFFGPRRARQTQVRAGIQEVLVTVRGGYSPDVVRVQQGVPIRLIFDRRESGDCTSRVVFSDFGINAALPTFGQDHRGARSGAGRKVRFRVRHEHGARPADCRAGRRRFGAERAQ